MTKNQIDYAKLKEEHRHNVVEEVLGTREVGAKELTAATGYESMKEAGRHNLATEAYSYANLDELRRHNVSLENVNWYTAQSDRTYKEAQASIGFTNAQTAKDTQLETVRHNKVNELEDLRHNQVVEGYEKDLKSAQSHEAFAEADKDLAQSKLYEAQAKRETNARFLDTYKATEQAKYWQDSIMESYLSDTLGAAESVAKLGFTSF